MQISKSTLFSVFGLIVLLLFLALAYQQNSIFLRSYFNAALFWPFCSLLK